MIIDVLISKWRFIAFVIVLSIVFNAPILSVLGYRSSEVLYDYDVIVAMCLPDSKSCIYSSELKIANTGDSVAHELHFTVDGMPKGISSSFKIMNLVASSPRDSDPVITRDTGDAGFRLESLTPGALVVVDYSGDFMYSERKDIKNISVYGKGDASIVEANPHGVAFSRFFSALFFW